MNEVADMDVHGAVCVVTGAAGGIGAALAEALLERGAKVALTDLDGERLSATRERLATAHGDVVAAAGDASSAADIAEVIALTDLDGERLSATRERLATAHGDVVAAAGDA
ncbi:SDR family NAD(P)-dependent oxidoreductase, partial [Dermacoccus sp. GAS27A]|uniref:SDR family NAD(P)-dependent oxidoreductase n=1 Tax=Dermacoccus sp. GAS27A TaxID=3156270 RepID=UPI0038373BD0